MFAHHQGGLLNAAQLARGLGVSGTTIAHYLDLMVDLLLVRRLAPRLPNAGKRLVRSPKVYIRDSGLVHALLGLGDKEAVLGHPIAGPSWEGMAIENLLAAAGAGGHRVRGASTAPATARRSTSSSAGPTARSGRSRSSAASRRPRSAAFTPPSPTSHPQRALIVYPGTESYRLTPPIEAIGLAELCEQAQARSAR